MSTLHEGDYDTPALHAFAVKCGAKGAEVAGLMNLLDGLLLHARDSKMHPYSFTAALAIQLATMVALNPFQDRTRLIEDLVAALRADIERLCLACDRDPTTPSMLG